VRHLLERLGVAAYSVSDVERWTVADEVDREIIQRVREAGAPGVLPKDVAAAPALVKYCLKYYHVARRIVRMNKKLLFESGKLLFEKRGHKWALTSFGFDAWGDIERVS
jgi:ATP-dependent RNA circularization protein (DNA/RNA ligase family)